MIKVKQCLVLITCLVSLLIAGCETPMYKKIDTNINDVQGKVDIIKKDYENPPPVMSEHGIYANLQPINEKPMPYWANNRVSLHGSHLPFDFYVTRVMNGSNVNVSYQPGLNTDKFISMDYSGTVKGALDNLAAKTGYSYQIDGNTVTWSGMVEKTFDISFMPGSTEYLVGGQGKSNSNAENSNSVYFGDLGNTSNEYSSMRGALSVWNDLSRTLDNLKSAEGRVVVSQATTTVTVYDHPANVAMMTNYLNQLNKSLSRQVALQVQVIEVELNSGFNYGIDWNLIRKVMGVYVGVQGSNAQPVTLSPIGSNSSTTSGFIMKGIGAVVPSLANTASAWDSSTLLINALKQQGKVSVATEPRVVTLNNQVAEIGINQLQGYLEAVSTTFTGVNANVPTESLTPGIIKTGFSLYILPKVKSNQVYLQISSDLSRLQNIQRIQSSAADNSQSIQVPTIAVKIFNQRSVVPSGDTLVIAGFKQVSNQTGNTQTLGIPMGVGAANANLETIILITPTILG